MRVFVLTVHEVSKDNGDSQSDGDEVEKEEWLPEVEEAALLQPTTDGVKVRVHGCI